MATDDVDKKPPKYMVPPTFTESFMRTSGSRSKQFFNGIKGWVNSHDKLAKDAKTARKRKAGVKDKRLASKLAGVIERSYVTLPEFLGSFQRHLQTLNRLLPGPYYQVVHASEDSSTGLMLPKSSAWLSSMVEKELDKKHARQGLLQVIKNKVRLLNHDDDKVQWPVTSGRNIVYIDDGIYSGQQLLAFCFALVGYLWKFRSKANNIVTRSMALNKNQHGHTHVWVMIPYRTQQGQQVLTDLETGFFPDVMLEYLEVANDIVREIPDVYAAVKGGANLVEIADFAAEVLKFHVVHLNEYQKIPDKAKVFKEIGLKYDESRGAGLTVFEHKVPDGMSFPETLTFGHLVRNGKLSIHTMPFEGNRFVRSDDDKPYSKDRPGMIVHLAGSRNNMAVPKIINRTVLYVNKT